MPKRMKGYGREFSPSDKHDWEKLVQEILMDLESLRRLVFSDR